MAVHEEQRRDHLIVRTSVIAIFTNLCLVAFKVLVGLMANSIAIVLDAMNNLSDALSSIITILGMQFASLLGGSVITEQVFAWPGVGRLVIQSITTSDFAVVECIVFLMAVIFVVINFIVDVLYCVINPRVRLQ